MSQRLYKAKAAHNGEWVVGYYLEVGGVPFILPKGKPLNAIVQVIPETVCQEIGMKDMDGTQIFESDIIRIVGRKDWDWNDEKIVRNYQGVVTLVEGCIDDVTYCKGFFYINGYGETDRHELYESMCRESAKVIGNIHDKEPDHA